MMLFSDFHLDPLLLQAIEEVHYTQATKIQEQAIPLILQGHDLLGIAQTGTGKTAAFALPILHNLLTKPLAQSSCSPKALILVPTRELALQIAEHLKRYGRHTHLRWGAIFGGVNENPQIRAIKKGIDILVATPGRLMDLHKRSLLPLNNVSCCVLDEADRMLDMGFLPAIKSIMGLLPNQRQTLLFSATFPKGIEHLVQSFLKQPKRVEVAPPATVTTTIDSCLLFIPKAQKQELLQHIIEQEKCERLIVFSKTKYGADRIGRRLRQANIVNCVLHGDKSQRERQRALKEFQQGTSRILIATDVASRGIDISNVSHVINFDLPNEPESYVHRIGRTGRAGKCGVAYSFCDAEEKPLLRAIEKKIQQTLPIVSVKRFWNDFVPMEQPQAPHKPFHRHHKHHCKRKPAKRSPIA